jgi:hypothetical protein
MRRAGICVASLVFSCLLFSVQTARTSAAEATEPNEQQCAAATPIENPWTKRLPQGWWKMRHEEILSAPGREEAQIIFIGDSITDGWDAEGGGLKVWEAEYVPMKALNLGINCESTIAC